MKQKDPDDQREKGKLSYNQVSHYDQRLNDRAL